jgi:hypothetical protein
MGRGASLPDVGVIRAAKEKGNCSGAPLREALEATLTPLREGIEPF